MSRTLVQLVLCLLWCLVLAKVEWSYVRIQQEINDRKIVTLTNHDQIVNFLLESDGSIVDCATYRHNDILLLLANFEEKHARNSSKVQHLRQHLDVPWYGRRCSKLMRDSVHEGKLPSSPSLKQFVERQQLNRARLGTKFCTRYHPHWNHQSSDVGELDPVDSCCRQLHACGYSLSPMRYGKGYWNVNFEVLHWCPCVAEFHDCLQSAQGQDLARQMHRLFFGLLDLKCYQIRSTSKCLKYSTWFDSCLQQEQHQIMTVTHFSQYNRVEN